MARIHQEVSFAEPPSRVYRALLDSAEHAKFTGSPAELGNGEGDPFSAHGGRVLGRNVELIPDRRIVQAWRLSDWPEGVYSITRFELQGEGEGTLLVFDHEGFPENAGPHLEVGWERMYWEPLRKYFEG